MDLQRQPRGYQSTPKKLKNQDNSDDSTERESDSGSVFANQGEISFTFQVVRTTV